MLQHDINTIWTNSSGLCCSYGILKFSWGNTAVVWFGVLRGELRYCIKVGNIGLKGRWEITGAWELCEEVRKVLGYLLFIGYNDVVHSNIGWTLSRQGVVNDLNPFPDLWRRCIEHNTAMMVFSPLSKFFLLLRRPGENVCDRSFRMCVCFSFFKALVLVRTASAHCSFHQGTLCLRMLKDSLREFWLACGTRLCVNVLVDTLIPFLQVLL